MSLRLTPDLLAAAYDYLLTTDPFKGWKLPEADDVGFAVVSDPTIYADFCVTARRVPIIRVSTVKNGHTSTVISTVAHEAIHLQQWLTKKDKGGDHNADFWRKAKRVCAVHGWDLKTF